MKSITIKKMLSCIAVICGIASAWMLTGCKGNSSADLVVYGKIFTAEGGQMAEAFAVKDGKYVYVGDKDVLTCPVTEIHTAKPAATYFEGKKVFSQTVADESAYTPIDYSNETPLGDHAPVSAKFRYLPQ